MSKKIIFVWICFATISMLTAGCMTTTQKGTAVGTGVGAALGTGIGALAGHAGMGAIVGAGAGAVGGALVGDHMDQKRDEAEKANLRRQLELERQSGSGRGQNKIEGHYEYVKKRKWVDTSKKRESGLKNVMMEIEGLRVTTKTGMYRPVTGRDMKRKYGFLGIMNKIGLS